MAHGPALCAVAARIPQLAGVPAPALVAHLIVSTAGVRGTALAADSVDTCLSRSLALLGAVADPVTGALAADLVRKTVRLPSASCGADPSHALLSLGATPGGGTGGSPGLTPVNGVALQPTRAGAQSLVVLGAADGVHAAVADGARI